MDHVRRVVLGLGSNVGDRAARIAEAVERLTKDGSLRVLSRSPLYESPPAGGPEQGDYLNAAIVVATSLEAREILARGLEVERALGRERPDTVRNGPRTIDVDILWIEGEHFDDPDLGVPHRRLAERAFALKPLVDVAPDASDPRTGTPYASLAAALPALKLFTG